MWLMLIFALMKIKYRFLSISKVWEVSVLTQRECFAEQGNSFGSWIIAMYML